MLSRSFAVIALLILCAGFAAPLHAASEEIDGDWIGQIDFGGAWQRINFHFSTDGGVTTGTLDLPAQGRNGLPLKQVALAPPRIRIEWEGRSGLAIYDGEIRGDFLSGAFSQGTTRGSFRVVRTANAQPDLEAYRRIAGSYEVGRGRFIDIAPFFEDENRPIFFDSGTRRTGILYALTESEFFSGPSYGVMSPPGIRVAFVTNRRNEVTGLRWQEGDARTLRARRLGSYREEEVEFRNGNVVLRGTLTLPSGPGPHPLVVQVHGSGPAQRPGGHWTHFFVRQGIGYFYYDKRGSGASTGDLHSASIDDLAGDALAAVAALRSRSDIDEQGVGLWGNSNGGWVAPLAASRSRDVAFLIVKSGSALSVHENILYELEMDMRAAGTFSDAEIASARDLRRQLNAALLTNQGWDALRAAIDQASGQSWFPYARVQWLPTVEPPLDSVTNPILSGFRRQIDFDPRSAWESVDCPTLVLLGELDANVPAAQSAAMIEAALRRGGNRDHEVRILPAANHGLFEAETGYSTEWPRLTRYVPGYMDGMADWLRARVATRRTRRR